MPDDRLREVLAILDAVKLDGPPPCPQCGRPNLLLYNDVDGFEQNCYCGWSDNGGKEQPLTLATAPWTKSLAEVIRRAREVARG